ncbi:addiction module antidote protein [Bradyrhizobium sp. A11]|uniref:addiction module antidote protein n=1 Tax=Bradyrhizobium sp. A11 TaxID=3133974 RepID=UPI00324EABB7
MEAALESDDPSFIAAAIGDLAKARGVSNFSRETGLSREAIYKTFRVGGNPTLDTLSKATIVLGYPPDRLLISILSKAYQSRRQNAFVSVRQFGHWVKRVRLSPVCLDIPRSAP